MISPMSKLEGLLCFVGSSNLQIPNPGQSRWSAVIYYGCDRGIKRYRTITTVITYIGEEYTAAASCTVRGFTYIYSKHNASAGGDAGWGGGIFLRFCMECDGGLCALCK